MKINVIAALICLFICPLYVKAQNSAHPYESFPFLLKMGNRYLAGFSEVEGINQNMQQHLKPNDRNKFETITLKRGITNDAGFKQWAGMQRIGNSKPPREEIILELYNEARKLQLTCHLHNCRALSYTGPALNGKGGADIAIEELTIEAEGLEKD